MTPTLQHTGKIEIEPQVALTDVPMTIRLTGLLQSALDSKKAHPFMLFDTGSRPGYTGCARSSTWLDIGSIEERSV